MTLTTISLSLAALLYVLITAGYISQRDYPHALAYFAYALANVGFIWYEFTKTGHQ